VSDLGAPYLHWYITIVPRISWCAGFEIGSGIYINPSLPEECAECARFLRGVDESILDRVRRRCNAHRHLTQEPNDTTPYNRMAWDKAVERESQWTVPVTPATIAAARRGEWQIVLTPTQPDPAHLVPTAGRRRRALSGQRRRAAGADPGGGRRTRHRLRQLAAATGARSLRGAARRADPGDGRGRHARPERLCRRQLRPDRAPDSNLFVPDVRPVWRECYRVLRPGGVLLAGFCNPIIYLFDQELADDGVLAGAPRAALLRPHQPERRRTGRLSRRDMQPLEFGHTLTRPDRRPDRRRLFAITGFYEDELAGH
jgi:hypothetical protein